MKEFENFTNHIQDLIFEETCKYLTDVVGDDQWGDMDEAHSEVYLEVHGKILYNVVKELAKRMRQ